MKHRSIELLIAIAVFGITFAIFMPALRADFVQWDDDRGVYQNPNLRDAEGIDLAWVVADRTVLPRFVPLSLLTWEIISQFCQVRPFGYHLWNVLVHGANAALLFFVLCRLLERRNEPHESRLTAWLLACAGLGAVLWSLHPMRVEAVAWVSCTYGQGVLFLLISLLCYLRSRPRDSGTRTIRAWHWLSVAAFGVAVLSHPVVVGFPAVLLALDGYPLGRIRLANGGWRTRSFANVLLEKAPFAIIAATGMALSVWARARASDIFPRPPTLAEFSLAKRCAQASYLWAYYVWRPWYPVNLMPAPTTLFRFTPILPYVLSALGVALATVLLVVRRRVWPAALTIWVCHLALLVPVLGWTEYPHFPCDRYALLQGMTWSAAIAALLWNLARRQSRRRFAVAIVILALAAAPLLARLTLRQLRIWHDSAALFAHMIDQLGAHPYRADIYLRLGDSYAARGERDKAMHAYLQANDADPSDMRAVLAAGRSLIDDGQLFEAAERFRTALRVNPEHDAVRIAHASVLTQRRQFEEAIASLQDGMRIHPDSTALVGQLAIVLTQAGRSDEAQEHLRRALERFPEDPALRQLLYEIQLQGDRSPNR